MAFRDIAEPDSTTRGAASDLLQWSATPTSNEVVVDIAGELDSATATELGHALAHIVAEQPSTLTLELAQLTFMDSSGIRCLLGAANQAAAAGCRLTVRNPSAAVLRVMEICGVDAILLTGTPEGASTTRR